MHEKAGSDWWQRVDWSLPLREVARVAGVSLYAVQKKRVELGLPSLPLGPRQRDLSKVDWTKSDTEIARELSITRQGVSYHRQRLGASIPTRQPPPERIAWSKLDWSMKNAELARQTGSNAQMIAQQRRRWSSLVVTVGPSRQFSDVFARADWSKSDAQLSQELGLRRSTVYVYRQRAGQTSPPRKKKAAKEA